MLAREADGDVILRFDVATAHVAAADTTGAGDAFDAGFLARPGSPPAPRAGRSPTPSSGPRVAGHRAAARQLTLSKQELPPG